jgi:DNA-binding protein YbaB
MLKGLGDLGQIMKMQKEMKNIQKKIQKTKIEVKAQMEVLRSL